MTTDYLNELSAEHSHDAYTRVQDDRCVPNPNVPGCGTHGRAPCPADVKKLLGPGPFDWTVNEEGCVYRYAVKSATVLEFAYRLVHDLYLACLLSRCFAVCRAAIPILASP
jgi:hypothetical protein